MNSVNPLLPVSLKKLSAKPVSLDAKGTGLSKKARDLAKTLLPRPDTGVLFTEFIKELNKQFPDLKPNVVYTQARQALIDFKPFTIRRIVGRCFLVRLRKSK